MIDHTTPIISLYGPWANWVALGWKTVETRTHKRFAKLEGKRIGIHVAKHWDAYAVDVAWPYLNAFQIEESRHFLKATGAIICTAFVNEFRELTKADAQAALIECSSIKRYGLFLRDVDIIPAIPCSGNRGIWYYYGGISNGRTQT